MSVRALYLLLIIALSGCAGMIASTPTQRIALGDTLLRENFTESFAWQEYWHPDLNVDFRIVDAMYRARAWDGGFTWTLQPPAYDNVVIDIEATQLSTDLTNFYGVMCRAAPHDNGNGYYFLITGFGEFTIRRGAVGEINALIPFTPSAAIRQGRAINRIRAVCIDDYLALYVNGQFVAETRDRHFTRGYVGIAAAAADGAETDIAFDALIVTVGELLR